MTKKLAHQGRPITTMNVRALTAVGGGVLFLLAACSGTPQAATTAQGPGPAPSDSAASTSPAAVVDDQAQWADTLCARPEFSAIRNQAKLETATTGFVYFSGGNEYRPAMQYCTLKDWNIGTTLLPFGHKQFKAEQRKFGSTTAANVGDEAFILLQGRGAIARTGDVGVSVELSGFNTKTIDKNSLIAALKAAVAHVDDVPKPSLTAGSGLCAAGTSAATSALGSTPPIQRGRLVNNYLACLWGDGTHSVIAGAYQSTSPIDAKQSGYKSVSGLGLKAAWIGWADRLEVQLANNRTAYITMEGPDQRAAIAVYKAMEQTFKDTAKAG